MQISWHSAKKNWNTVIIIPNTILSMMLYPEYNIIVVNAFRGDVPRLHVYMYTHEALVDMNKLPDIE